MPSPASKRTSPPQRAANDAALFARGSRRRRRSRSCRRISRRSRRIWIRRRPFVIIWRVCDGSYAVSARRMNLHDCVPLKRPQHGDVQLASLDLRREIASDDDHHQHRELEAHSGDHHPGAIRTASGRQTPDGRLSTITISPAAPTQTAAPGRNASRAISTTRSIAIPGMMRRTDQKPDPKDEHKAAVAEIARQATAATPQKPTPIAQLQPQQSVSHMPMVKAHRRRQCRKPNRRSMTIEQRSRKR